MKRARAEVLSVRRLGAYHTITLVAPEIAERARPGQFVSVAVPPGRAYLLRRPFWVHAASRRGGWAGTFEFAFDVRGPGTAWLARRPPHTSLDVIGPLGRAFAYPRRLRTCLLVGEGHGVAALRFLAEELRARGRRVDMLIGGATLEEVFKPIEAKRLSTNLAIVTRDGSLGDRGRVIDVLEERAARWGTEVVYAAGPRDVLRGVARFCRERRIPAQVALEERMGCGTGLCFGCAVPVARTDGTGFDHLRACVEGPVFNPARIVWDRWGGTEGATPLSAG